MGPCQSVPVLQICVPTNAVQFTHRRGDRFGYAVVTSGEQGGDLLDTNRVALGHVDTDVVPDAQVLLDETAVYAQRRPVTSHSGACGDRDSDLRLNGIGCQ